ncbi:MAG: GNAT family N-acetyltransferase [Bacteroidales bacterium]|jgi:GNAT superfamily N-acetyltransferase|nr:GNAT family N-acetyltransferase [Bacteroidales bacterium]MDD2825105.1 GNAT family N-acetyltransferase [Bacteroidales bacterium]MDD3099823.1 GNAT family N-acetyltransferase [Bacteroidales bacterium]MDD3638671.1 GNAT family N-acetyltransferase [Bacteroidales bacterium]MDD4480765.1 GNAT family N-acetyltransferase [Bacteroidales bacterium]
MVIRKATKEDAAVLAQNQVRMALESENIVLEYPMVKKGTDAYLADENRGTAYIAEIDGKIAGSLLITKEWSDWRNAWIWWIQSVYTVPEFRRRGVYKALYRYLQDLVHRSDDVIGIRLYVARNNAKARETYRKLGMTDEHYITYEWLGDPDTFKPQS